MRREKEREGRRREEGGERREGREGGRREGREGVGRGKEGSVCGGGVWPRYLDSLEPSLYCFTEEISESTEPERRERKL